MSVAFETNTNSDSNRIRSPGFAQGMWIYNSSETARFTGDDHRSSKFPVDKDEDDQDSSSSSSIGNNSDASGGEGDSDDDAGGGEVQSLFKGSLNNLCALEQALPIKYDFLVLSFILSITFICDCNFLLHLFILTIKLFEK